MNFDFSNEQKQLRDSAKRMLERACPMSRVRLILEDPDASFDRDLWRIVAEQGWLGANIPEDYGGLGSSYLELCCIAEALGGALAPVPFASTAYLFAEALLLAGSDAQKQAHLPRIVMGELIGALATAEAPGPVTRRSLSAEVRSGRLSGTKVPVADGSSADSAVVLAVEDGEASLFLVDLAHGAVSREKVATIDPTRDAARLRFEGVPAERLGAAGAGFELLARIEDRAAVPIAFEQIGGADRALELARDYAMSRYAFGRPIAANQAIKHRLADVYIRNVLARSNAHYGAWALSTGAEELPLAAATARVSACDAYWFAAKEDIQVHGGMGFTWEFDCHLFYRRAIHLGLVIGASRVWKQRLVTRLRDRRPRPTEH